MKYSVAMFTVTIEHPGWPSAYKLKAHVDARLIAQASEDIRNDMIGSEVALSVQGGMQDALRAGYAITEEDL